MYHKIQYNNCCNYYHMITRPNIPLTDPTTRYPNGAPALL